MGGGSAPVTFPPCFDVLLSPKLWDIFFSCCQQGPCSHHLVLSDLVLYSQKKNELSIPERENWDLFVCEQPGLWGGVSVRGWAGVGDAPKPL